MGLNISAGLVPTGGGAWETHDATYGKGGFRSVLDNTARDAIPAARRTEGMLVYINTSGNTYRLGTGLTNGDWILQSSGAITAGNGLTGTTALAVLANGASIEVSASGVRRAALSGAVSAAAGSNVTAFASGDFGALDLVTTGTLRLGLAAGSGSGVASCASVGNIRGSRGTFRSAGGTGFCLSARANNDLSDVDLLAWDSAAANVSIGGGNGVALVDFSATTGWRFRDGVGTNRHAWTQVAYSGRLSTFTIDALTGANSVWTYQATASASGFSWDFSGQNATTTGGNMTFAPGTGATGGFLDFRNAAGTSRMKINDTGIGFFNTAPAAKPAPTGSRGGNAALASLLTGLATLGLITDSTSA